MQQQSQEQIQESTDRFHNVIRRKGDRLVKRTYNPDADLFVYEAFAPHREPGLLQGSYMRFEGIKHVHGNEFDPEGEQWSTFGPGAGELHPDEEVLEALKLIRELFPETNHDYVGRINRTSFVFLGPAVVPDGQQQRAKVLTEKCRCGLARDNHHTFYAEYVLKLEKFYREPTEEEAQ